MSNLCVEDHLLSDHSSVHFDLSLAKPPLPTKEISYRKIKSIDMDEFKLDIVNSGLPDLEGDDVDALVETYNSTLTGILDKHAPVKTRKVTIHPHAPWLTDSIKEIKRDKRKAERKWRQTGLTIHREIYTDLRNKMNESIASSKKDFFQQRIEEASSSQSALFQCVNELFGKKKCTALPAHDDPKELCDRMASFFSDKIKTIHEGLEEIQDGTNPLELTSV